MDKTTPEELSDKWQARYDKAVSNQTPKFKRFAQWYDEYNAVYRDEGAAPWRSKITLPTMHAKANDMMAKFISSKPSLVPSVRRGDVESEDLSRQAEIIGYALEEDYDGRFMDEPIRFKLEAALTDAIVCGIGIAKAPWCVKKRVRREREVDELGFADMSQHLVKESYVGYNDMIPVNLFNFFIDPGATSLQGAHWVIIKEFKTLPDLEAVNDGEGDERYKNLDKLKETKASADPMATYKASRNRIVGEEDPISADTTIEQFPIYECYDRKSKKILTFAEYGQGNERSWLCIRDQQNPYWHEQFPLVPFYVKKRPHDVWGMGIFETNQRLNAAKRDLFNHFMDQWNLSVNSGLISRADSIIDEFIVEPGMNVEYEGDVKPEAFKFADPNISALQGVMAMIEKEVEANTISSYASGQPNSETDQTSGTATGIARIQEAAGDTLGYFRANYKESLKILFGFWLSNRKQYMAMPEQLSQTDENKEPIVASPNDMIGDIDLTIDDESLSPMSKQDRRENFLAMTNQLLALQDKSIQQAQVAGTKPMVIDFNKLAEETAEEFGYSNFDQYLVSDEEMAQIQAEQQQQQAAMQQQQMDEQNAMAQQEQEAQMQQEQAAQAKQVAPFDDEARKMYAEAVAGGQM